MGAFAQDPLVEIDAQIADKYFTHCEPPHLDQWTHETDAFTQFTLQEVLRKNLMKTWIA